MSAVNPVTLTHRAEQSDEVLVQDVGGEVVLLDLASERYFGLDPVGTRIWTLLGEDSHLQTVSQRLCNEYEADPVQITGDLLALVEKLAEAGLVKLT